MKCYRVGGAVRDTLLQIPYRETDWVVVGATPEEMERRGFKRVGKDFPVFLHPETNEEYALARTERKAGRGYYGFEIDAHPDVTLEQDLLRRDLTVNAMAIDDDGSIIDPYGGQQDLQQKLLRHVSPAFSEDPLRVLRVARFAARYHHLGFRVADDTLRLMQQISASGELTSLARERIWQELIKGLSEQSPQTLIQVMLDCGAMAQLFPDWAASIDDRLLAALARSAAAGLDTEQRFALCCANLSLARCDTLCTALSAARAHARLARLLLRVSPLATGADLSAESVLATLETCDALRRPQLIRQIVAIEQCLNGSHGDIYLEAAAAAGAVRADNLAHQQLSGKALGEALRAQRLQRIESLL